MASEEQTHDGAATGSGAAAPNNQPIIIQQSPRLFGRFGKLLVVALILAVMTILGMAATYQSYFNPAGGPQERFHSLSERATKKIALISATGAILEGDGFVKQQIDRVRDDDDVVAVVLRINSPGGTVTGSDYIYHHLRKLAEDRDLPLVVSMGSICASGGYYIAMAVGDQTDSIYAEPTTWTGSIGVIIPHYDVSGLLNRYDIQEDSISSGPLKQMGNPTRPMSEQEREILQGLVDESFAGFKAIIKNGRPKFRDAPEALDEVATGQVFTADQALSKGLIDKIGFVEAAIDRAVELSGHDADELRCVKYQPPQTLLGALMGAHMASRGGRPLDLAAWFNLATPRAYYLFTRLQPAFTNSRP